MENALAGSLTQLFLYFGGAGVVLSLLGIMLWLVIRQYQQGVLADNKRLTEENKGLRENLKTADADNDELHARFNRMSSRAALLETVLIRAGVEVPDAPQT